MFRRAAFVVVTLCLCPASVRAQSTELTITATVANVRKGPSTSTAVIGTAPRGTVLKVTREFGRWVKISWPGAQDGVGYVHLSVGTIARGAQPTTEPEGQSARPLPPLATSALPAREEPRVAMPVRLVRVAPPSHIVGLGGRIGGSPIGFGATARAWTRDRLGVQLEVSRSVRTSVVSERVTVMQFAPNVLYSMKDRVTDNVWLRPYVGAGMNLYRSTVGDPTLPPGASVSDNSLGFQTFGGSELTFPSLPRFAVSGDVGYRWAQTPSVGVELGGVTLSISGHWYFR